MHIKVREVLPEDNISISLSYCPSFGEANLRDPKTLNQLLLPVAEKSSELPHQLVLCFLNMSLEYSGA